VVIWVSTSGTRNQMLWTTLLWFCLPILFICFLEHEDMQCLVFCIRNVLFKNTIFKQFSMHSLKLYCTNKTVILCLWYYSFCISHSFRWTVITCTWTFHIRMPSITMDGEGHLTYVFLAAVHAPVMS
jgi:hypothetical protein